MKPDYTPHIDIEAAKWSWKNAPDEHVFKAIGSMEDYAPQVRLIIVEEAERRGITKTTNQNTGDETNSAFTLGEKGKQIKDWVALKKYNRQPKVILTRITLSVLAIIVPFMLICLLGYDPKDDWVIKVGGFFIISELAVIWKFKNPFLSSRGNSVGTKAESNRKKDEEGATENVIINRKFR